MMAGAQLQTVRAEFPRKLAPLFEQHRHTVVDGGRGGGRSWGIARALLILGNQQRLRILCARELQMSIKDSVHKLLADQIDTLQLGAYKVQERDITNSLGTEFIFAGLWRNLNKIKSIEGIDVCWVEEAEKVSKESWQVLLPTIRKPGSRIIVSYNPDLETDPTHQLFQVNPPPDTVRISLSWMDNPWFPDDLRRLKNHAYRTDPESADHVWGGQLRKNSKAAVLHGKWKIDQFATPLDADGPYYGADWGFSVDPSALIKCWVRGNDKGGRDLLIEHEAYQVGVELDHMPTFFNTVPGADKHTIYGDNARPETISHMCRRGFNVLACAKWDGSVEDGIAFLRGFDSIIIHERCVNTIAEAKLWSYKVDRLSGLVLPELVDKWNHAWDAVRYALGPLIKARDGIVDFYQQQLEAQRAREAEALRLENERFARGG